MLEVVEVKARQWSELVMVSPRVAFCVHRSRRPRVETKVVAVDGVAMVVVANAVGIAFCSSHSIIFNQLPSSANQKNQNLGILQATPSGNK